MAYSHRISSEKCLIFSGPKSQALSPALQIFLCADLWKDAATLRAAYHDSEGVTEAFIKNGMQHALRTLGCEAAGDASKWEYEVCGVPGPRVPLKP